MVTGIDDPNKSRAQDHRSLKLGSKLKYLNWFFIFTFHALLQLSHFSYLHWYAPGLVKWTSSFNLWGLTPLLFLFPSSQNVLYPLIKDIGRIWNYRSTIIIYDKRTVWKTYFPYWWFRELTTSHWSWCLFVYETYTCFICPMQPPFFMTNPFYDFFAVTCFKGTLKL